MLVIAGVPTRKNGLVMHIKTNLIVAIYHCEANILLILSMQVGFSYLYL